MTEPQEAAKPTLHEIANMGGFGNAAVVVRRYYDPKFAIGSIPGEDGEQLYSVEIEWSSRSYGTDTIEVWANSASDAEDKAEQEWTPEYEDAEIDSVEAELKS